MDLLENAPLDGPRHPWEERRCAFFTSVLRGAIGGRQNLDVLDCGAGDAWFASRIREDLVGVRSVTCWDSHYDATSLARLGSRYPRLRLTKEPPRGAFDLILMMDVLEHVEDDVAFARATASLLAPGGIVLVSVPAWSLLFSRHDTFLKHYRRYSPAQCDEVLSAVGLTPLARGGAFHSLVLPRTLEVARERLVAKLKAPLDPIHHPTGWTHGKVVTSVVTGLLRIDNAVSKTAARARLNLPGLSYWVLATRAES